MLLRKHSEPIKIFAVTILSALITGCSRSQRIIASTSSANVSTRFIPSTNTGRNRADPPPLDRVVSQMDDDSTRTMIAQLGPQDRAVLILRYWHEMSEDEIAKSLDMTVSAAKAACTGRACS
jgi:RNA polymerase sigma factor (sigma-70 family)